MYKTVNLLAIPEHQMANRQFAIGNLLSKTVATFDNVKVRGNMIQSIALPWNANMDYVNMVEIDGMYYDVLNIDDVTDEQRQTTISVILNPVATYLSPNAVIGGWFERTPVNVKPGGPVQIGNDAMVLSRRYALNRIQVVDQNTAIPLFVQISSKYSMDDKDSSRITMYGTLAGYVPQFMAWSAQVYYHSPGGKLFLTLKDVISDLDAYSGNGTDIGLPADSIIDVSVSPRCPWRYSFDGDVFSLLDVNGGAITPRDAILNRCFTIINNREVGRPSIASHTVQFSELERYCGKITLVDEAGNDIALIPNEYLNASNQLEIDVQAMSDVSGIYTNVGIRGVVYTLQEGHLPWVGDAWQDYRARSLAYDREALNRGVESIDRQRNIDTLNAVGNSMLTTSVGGISNPAGAVLGIAQMGLGIKTAEMTAQLNKDNMYANQAAKEGLIKNSPSNNYQTGYGLDYMFKQYKIGGAHIKIELPANLTQTDFNNYIAYQGWPCNKYASFNLVGGYIKGNVYSLPGTENPANGPGPDLDMLRREIAQGFRTVIV